jgi:voltage-gated potassium channel
VILVVIPLLAAVFALAAGLAALIQIRRLFGMDHTIPTGHYTVVYGMQPAVPQILEELVAAGRTVVLVADVDPSQVHHKVQLVAGDPTNEVVIRHSHPERASDALVACPADGDVLVTCVALRSLAPSLDVFALARSSKIVQALRELGVARTLSSDELVAHTLAKSLETPHAGDLLLPLVHSERYRMAEIEVTPEMVGVAPQALTLDPPAIVLGVLRDGEVTPTLADAPQLRAGDMLITSPSVPHGKQQPAGPRAAARCELLGPLHLGFDAVSCCSRLDLTNR